MPERQRELRYACAPGDEPAPATPEAWPFAADAWDGEEAACQAAEVWDRDAAEYQQERSVWVLHRSTGEVESDKVFMHTEPVYSAAWEVGA